MSVEALLCAGVDALLVLMIARLALAGGVVPLESEGGISLTQRSNDTCSVGGDAKLRRNKYYAHCHELCRIYHEY